MSLRCNPASVGLRHKFEDASVVMLARARMPSVVFYSGKPVAFFESVEDLVLQIHELARSRGGELVPKIAVVAEHELWVDFVDRAPTGPLKLERSHLRFASPNPSNGADDGEVRLSQMEGERYNVRFRKTRVDGPYALLEVTVS